ncbi:MAG: phosphoribosyltransferase family protein [Candidatus Bathyarchaeia archaeon]|jgi:adenine/guanine phosphoribosyltransferase-like PRPP-binding protein
MTHEIGGRESGVVAFKETDEVRVNDDAVLAPEAVRGEVGTIVKINRYLTEPAQLSERMIAVDRYQQLVKQPRETEILGFALQIFLPKIGDSLLVASNEVTLLSKFRERIDRLEGRLIAHLTDPQQFTVLGDGGLDVPFINQNFDAQFFGDLVRYVLRPKLGRTSTKVLSPEASGPPLAAVYASMAGLSFVRAVKVYDKARPQVPGTWRGTVVGDVKVPSATKKTEHYFAIPEGSMIAGDRVVIFDDVGFTGRTRNACIQLIEKVGAKVSAIVNVVEKSYGEPRNVTVNSKAILGITGFEPETDKTCRLKINELLLEPLKTPRIVGGVNYAPKRSLSTLREQ